MRAAQACAARLLCPSADTDEKVDDGAGKGDEGHEGPGRLFFNAAEILAGNINNGPDGEQIKGDAAQNNPFGRVHCRSSDR